MLEYIADLFLQGRHIPLDHCPHLSRVDTQIIVDQDMSHRDDLWAGTC